MGLDHTYDVGRLPCAVFHRNICTPCEKDLTSKRYFAGNSITAMSASKLVRSYGPKGGAGSRNDEAIFIRPPNAQVLSRDVIPMRPPIHKTRQAILIGVL